MKRQNNIYSKDTLITRLVEKLNAELPRHKVDEERLYRFEINADESIPLDWLALQKKQPKIYWSDREHSFETAGIGAAQILRDTPSSNLADTLKAIESNLGSAAGTIRYYGSIGFDSADNPAASWQHFGRFYFVVPEFELCREDGRMVFAYNMVHKPGSSREAITRKLISSLKELNFKGEISHAESVNKPFSAKILSRANYPSMSKWKANVLEAKDAMRLKRIKKIVLARKSVFRMSRSIDPVVLLQQVKNNSFRTYDFCLQPDESNAFIGCSPECLYRRNKKSIYSEAIAGTCLSGKTDTEQRCFQEKLLNSHKESEEHEYVFDDVKSALSKLCREVYILNKRDILPLRYVQHFFSRFRGKLKDNINTQRIIETLHPTAAVHGYPRRAASKEINKYEPFSRGWYAGPVGWIGRDSSEFAVGIRCGLVRGKEVSLFAGAGIVRESDPACEWEETENKLRQFLEVIT